MDKYLSIIKPRTFIAIVMTWLTTFLSLKYKFQYNFDLTLISIAILFPFVIIIRRAFQRREKALGFLSRLKIGIISVKSSIESNTHIFVEKKHKILEVLLRIPKSLNDSWVFYALYTVSIFILTSLVNVQEQLENPFGQGGIDGIKLETFDMDSFLFGKNTFGNKRKTSLKFLN
jgi:hypothetical protein